MSLRRWLCAACLMGIFCGFAAAQDVSPEIREHFAVAQAAQHAGNLDRAASEYRAILRIRPDFAEIQMNLGLVLHAQGKFDQSAAVLRQSLKLKPEQFAANLFQGINYCKLGRPAEAVPLLSKAVAAKPTNKQGLFWLGSALIQSGQAGSAILELEKASEALRGDIDILQLLGEAYQKAAQEQAEAVKTIAPDSPERRLLLAESFRAQQEWTAAEIYYLKLLEQSSPPGAHLGLGMVLLRQGKVQEALQRFRQELRSDPYSVEARCGSAEAFLLAGKLPEARAELVVALKIRPDQARGAVEAEGAADNLPDALRSRYEAALEFWRPAARQSDLPTILGVALAYTRLGDAGEAQRQWGLLARTLPAPPKVTPASRDEALEAVRKRQYERAIGGLLRHVKLQPRDIEARSALAQSYLATGEPARAAGQLREVLAIDHKNVAGRWWLARCYRDLALQTFEQIVTIQPDSYRAHQLLGEAYEAKRQDEKAVAEFRAALRAKPDLPGLHRAIGRTHLKNLRLEEAAAEFEAELRINAFDADTNTDLGGIYVSQGQPLKAIPLLERASQVQPGLTEAHRRLGKAFYDIGQYNKAEAELLQASAADDDGSTHYLLARTYRQLGRALEADQALQEVGRIKSARLKQAQDRADRVRQLDRQAP